MNPFKRIAATNRAIDESKRLLDEATAIVGRYGEPDGINISSEQTAAAAARDAARVLDNCERVRIAMSDPAVVKTTSERVVLPWLNTAADMAAWSAEVLNRIHQIWPSAIPHNLRQFLQ